MLIASRLPKYKMNCKKKKTAGFGHQITPQSTTLPISQAIQIHSNTYFAASILYYLAVRNWANDGDGSVASYY